MRYSNNKKAQIDLYVRFFLIGILVFKLFFVCEKGINKDTEIRKIVKNIKEKSDVQTVVYTKNSRKRDSLDDIIVKIANKYNVDPALIKAIIQVESSFNPKAVSYKGAKGLMQLMPVVIKTMGVKDPFDPRFNIEAGVKYFKKLLILFDNNIELALAAYNAGIKKVMIYRGVPPFRKTREYIRRVLRYYRYYKKEMVQARSGDHNV